MAGQSLCCMFQMFPKKYAVTSNMTQKALMQFIHNSFILRNLGLPEAWQLSTISIQSHSCEDCMNSANKSCSRFVRLLGTAAEGVALMYAQKRSPTVSYTYTTSDSSPVSSKILFVVAVTTDYSWHTSKFSGV